MRLAKVESLRKDIEVISQNHERDVDRKDAIIQVRTATPPRPARGALTLLPLECRCWIGT